MLPSILVTGCWTWSSILAICTSFSSQTFVLASFSLTGRYVTFALANPSCSRITWSITWHNYPLANVVVLSRDISDHTPLLWTVNPNMFSPPITWTCFFLSSHNLNVRQLSCKLPIDTWVSCKVQMPNRPIALVLILLNKKWVWFPCSNTPLGLWFEWPTMANQAKGHNALPTSFSSQTFVLATYW
jgi:hypothetical protein